MASRSPRFALIDLVSRPALAASFILAAFSLSCGGSGSDRAPAGTSQQAATIVTSTMPLPYEVDIPSGQDIQLRFSRMINASTATDRVARLTGSQSGPIDVQVLADQTMTDRVTVTPLAPFAAGEMLTLELSRDLLDSRGIAVEGFTLSFNATATAPAAPPAAWMQETIPLGGFGELLEAVDLDGDGRAELLSHVENDRRIVVLQADGTDAFASVFEVDAGEAIRSFEAADIDGDGDLDLLLGLALGIEAHHNVSSVGAISFQRGARSVTQSSARDILLADLDHRGARDLLLDTDRGIEVRLGGWDAPVSQVIGDRRLARSPLTLADIDGDGHPELLYGSATSQGLGVLRQEPPGSGSFGEPEDVATPGEVERVLIASLIPGELPEVICHLLANSGGAAPFVKLARDADTGDLIPQPAAAGSSIFEPGSAALVDIDGDGSPEIAYASPEDDSILVYDDLDRSTDFPGSPRTLFDAIDPGALRIADLDQDNVLDFLLLGSDELRIRRSGSVDTGPPDGMGALLSLTPIEASPGDRARTSRLLLDTALPLEGLTAVVGWDARVVEDATFEWTGSVLESAELVGADSILGENAVSIFAVVDFLFPIEGTTLPTGSGIELARLLVDIEANAPAGDSLLEFLDGLGNPPIENEVLHAGESMSPSTSPGVLSIRHDPGGSVWTADVRVGVVEAGAGADTAVPVTVSSSRPIDGLTVVFSWDPALLDIHTIDIEGTATQTADPEFLFHEVDPTGHGDLSLIMDYLPPFEGQQFAAGTDIVILNALATVPVGTAPGRLPIRVEDGQGFPPLDNLFVSDGENLVPVFGDGGIDVIDAASMLFVRGDVDVDGDIDAEDANVALNAIFGAAVAPCADAADFNDDGRLTVQDSTQLLDFALGRSTVQPAAPYPDAGVDPTDDDLGCEVFQRP